MSKLKISDSLSLPTDAVTQAIGWLGRRGSGKSYGATKLAELMHDQGAQFIAIDPVGIWYGLRVSADGKGKGIDIPIFGGLHGDIPIEATGGALLADLAVDRGISLVLDVSQFESDADKARFARDFAARFYFRKKASPSAVHIFIEECQEFIPQNIQKGEEQMLHAFQRMVRLGRNFGIGVSMITQRPQDVNKKALNQAECLFCFQLTGPQERKAVEDWVSDKGLSDDLSELLPNLKTGHSHVWSPVWLDINREVFIAQKETFAAGATPKVGQKPIEAKPLEPIELEKLRLDMAATIQKAKADDPRELRQRIAELERQAKTPPATAKVETKTVEKFVLKDGQFDRAEKLIGRLMEAFTKAGELQGEVKTIADEISAAIRMTKQAVPKARPFTKPLPTAIPARKPTKNITENITRNGDGTITPRQQRFLDAAATLTTLNAEVSRETIAGWLGIHPRGGSVGEELTALSEAGLITNDRGRITVTEAGINAAGFLDPAEAINRAKAGLSNRQRGFFDVICAAYPDGVTREQIAEQFGIHPRGGSLGEDLGALVGRGLVDRDRGVYQARAFLFLVKRMARAVAMARMEPVKGTRN